MRLINADELTDVYTIYDDYGDKHTVIDASDITGAPTINAIVIPKNATNGDMIKAMFSNTESRLDENTGIMLIKWEDGTCKTFKEHWWNAPYKGVSK